MGVGGEGASAGSGDGESNTRGEETDIESRISINCNASWLRAHQLPVKLKWHQVGVDAIVMRDHFSGVSGCQFWWGGGA